MVAFIIIKSSSNNTHVSVLNKDKQSIFSVSSGNLGYKGSKRGSAFAAESIGIEVSRYLEKNNFSSFMLFISGYGNGRFGVGKGLLQSNLRMLGVYSINKQVFNGCRKKKCRRL